MRLVKIISILLVMVFFFAGTVCAKSKAKDYDFGVGIGIPYGGLGVNMEVGKDYLFTAGLGLVPFTDASVKNTQIGWCAGLRTYFKKPLAPGLKWRASFLYGTVGVIEKRYANNVTGGMIKEFELRTGFAPCIGARAENWDFDIAYTMYDVPQGVAERWGKIKFSFGYRFQL